MSEIEDCFKKFTKRGDIDIILINQNVAELIRHLVDSHTEPVPTVLEIPSKDSPYDASKDSILRIAQVINNLARSFVYLGIAKLILLVDPWTRHREVLENKNTEFIFCMPLDPPLRKILKMEFKKHFFAHRLKSCWLFYFHDFLIFLYKNFYFGINLLIFFPPLLNLTVTISRSWGNTFLSLFLPRPSLQMFLKK